MTRPTKSLFSPSWNVTVAPINTGNTTQCLVRLRYIFVVWGFFFLIQTKFDKNKHNIDTTLTLQGWRELFDK